MKRIINIVIFSLLCIGLAPATEAARVTTSKKSGQDLDKLVAIVNDEIITQQQLDAAILRAKKQIVSAGAELPDDKALRTNVLDNLINERLQLQLAKRANITVTDKQVEDAVARVAQQNNMTPKEMLARVEQDGFSPSAYRKAIKNQLIVNQVQMQAVGSKVNIAPKEITALIEEYNKKVRNESQVRVIDILVTDGSEADANIILKKLRDGAALSDLSGVEVNDLDWRPLNALPDVFIAALSNLKENSYSAPVKAPNGWHILKLAGKRGSGRPPLSRQQAEQLLLQQKVRVEAAKWLKKMRENSYIKIIH